MENAKAFGQSQLLEVLANALEKTLSSMTWESASSAKLRTAEDVQKMIKQSVKFVKLQ